MARTTVGQSFAGSQIDMRYQEPGRARSMVLAARLLVAFAVLWIAQVVAAQDATATESAPVAGASTVTSSVSASATATALAIIEPVEHQVLSRPIALVAGNAHWADRTYPYGSTQWDARPVHLGVEFVNPRHTPVLAAAAGRVVFAGSDAETLVGPQLDYYGNVVVLEHDLRSLDGLPIFTLYAHLHSIAVAAGETVEVGDTIGDVGSTGIAIGAHLHFEVRAGDPLDATNTRNPELWLKNYINHGMIAGYVHDDAGASIFGKRVVVRSETSSREVSTYGSDRVNQDPVWGENFVVGDLPAGEYEIVVLKEGGAIGYRQHVDVLPYKITFVDIHISETLLSAPRSG